MPLAAFQRTSEHRAPRAACPSAGAARASFSRQVPHGVDFFVRLGIVEAPGDPDAFAAAAPRLGVFRIDRLLVRPG